MNSKISVVIPTKDDFENLKRLLLSLDKISKNIEIIIVDSESLSKQEKAILVNKRPYLRIISKESTPGKARNIGVKEANYNIIAMLDADTEITKEWYAATIVAMRYFEIVAGYSPDPNGKQLPRVPIMVDGQDITYPQCNIAYKKGVFERIGYLREDMNVAEDCEFHYRCAKAGIVIFYNPLMKAYHYERQTKKQWIKKQIKNGFGRYELEKVHPDLRGKSQHGLGLKSPIRLLFGAFGYLKGRLFGGSIKT